jgi:pimeloyl-ACP methyl ester carboxylesterase
MFRLLFGSAAGADRVLAADPGFRTAIAGVLRASLTEGLDGYMRDVRAYVSPWVDSLADVAVATCIWHGDADNWSPVGMARALADRLPGPVQVEILPGLSHYSCLHQALPAILRQAGEAES